MMPPHKAVHSLRRLANDRVLYTVCGVILEELFFGEQGQWEQLGHPVLTPRLQVFRDVLCNALVPKLLQELLNTILERNEAVEATVRFTAVQLLLVPGVTKLAVGHFPEPFYAPILSAIAESAAQLQTLDLRGVWVREMHKFYLCKVIRRIHTIRHLTLRYTSDDEILAIVGKHCPQLETLDISGSENISESGIRSLYEKRINDVFKGFNDCAKTLKVVDIGGPGAQHLPVSQVSLLLRFLPNLNSLGAFERTGAAVEILFEEDPTLRFNLIYLHDLYTTKQRMEIIVKACPKIQGMYLDCPKASAVHIIHLNKEMRNLRVHKCRWSDLELTLLNFHSRLRTLYMSTIFGTVNILSLSKYCPNLTRIELHGVTLISSVPDSPDPQTYRIFPELRELLIYRTPVSPLLMGTFMKSSEVLEHLSFGECNQITDEDLKDHLNSSTLEHLTQLWFGQAQQLSLPSLQLIIDKCPLVTSIGNLAAWALNSAEIVFMKMQLELSNTDLTLHDYGSLEQGEGFIILLQEEDHEE
ncbi:uncharacterized protein LOC108678312 [Hyalella azteca]|uniref:Uncharacterized protein LOC108678312 n=1 Tax=Hyalella azteca TaxID=294128 RepID=A0A8B7PAG3_HYAAZ|nr:uncharacterized protein LOC108678312 [Hyalella azteca]